MKNIYILNIGPYYIRLKKYFWQILTLIISNGTVFTLNAMTYYMKKRKLLGARLLQIMTEGES
jgi:hypothetical protein